MITPTLPYGMGTLVPLPFEAAVARTRDALAAEGFGILTEADVSATMRTKLDEPFRPYVILGACNPRLALQALNADLDIGLLLPCNVIVYAGDTPGESVVAALDPEAALSLTGREDIHQLALEVKRRLRIVIDDIGEAVGEPGRPEI